MLELQQELTGQPSAQMQKVGIQLRQMDAKLNVLLSGQVVIYEDLLNQLDATQLALTQKLYQVRLMTHKKTGVAKKLKSLPDLLGAINAYYDCSTGLDITGTQQVVVST